MHKTPLPRPTPFLWGTLTPPLSSALSPRSTKGDGFSGGDWGRGTELKLEQGRQQSLVPGQGLNQWHPAQAMVRLSHLSEGSEPGPGRPTDKDGNNFYWTTRDVL